MKNQIRIRQSHRNGARQDASQAPSVLRSTMPCHAVKERLNKLKSHRDMLRRLEYECECKEMQQFINSSSRTALQAEEDTRQCRYFISLLIYT